MSIALILDTRHPAWLAHAQSINDVLLTSALEEIKAELWLFHQGEKPAELPQMYCSITQIRWINLPAPGLAEQQLSLLMQLQQRKPTAGFIFSSSAEAAELATRLAWRLQCPSAVGVVRLMQQGTGWLWMRAVYGQQMQLTMDIQPAGFCLAVAAGGGRPSLTCPMDCPQSDEDFQAAGLDWLRAFEQRPLTQDSPLSHAPWVLVLGQGVGSEESLQRLQTLAQSLGIEVGISRPVAMNGWGDMSQVLGISGLRICASVCIVAGISGAAALMAGIDHSTLIVAINSDPQAAIFSQADVGIVGDLHEVLADMFDMLSPDKIKT